MKKIKFVIGGMLLGGAAFAVIAMRGIQDEYPGGGWLPRARAAIGIDAAGPTAQVYRFGSVVRGDLVSSVSATGALAPVATVLVGSQISGQLTELRADFNSEVKHNDVIALIDPVSFENEVEMAEAELSSAKAALQKARVALRDAEADFARKTTLGTQGTSSPVERIKAEAARDLAQAELDNAVAVVRKSEAALKQARTDLDRTRIRSPVDGIVIQRNVEAGQTVAASLQAPTLFVIAQDLRDMQVNASIDEAEIGRIAPGQRVEFTVDAHPGQRFAGTVHQIRKQPQTTQNVVTYTVIVRAPNPALLLMPGMTASARFIVAERRDVLKVPNAALRFRGQEISQAAGEASVWIEEAGELRRLPLQLGLTDGSQTEVFGDGLTEGLRVVVGMESPKQTRSAGKRLIGAF